MSEHRATIEWQRQSADFDYKTYNRTHSVDFGRDIRMPASGAPGNIPPGALGTGVDPEQALVGSLSSCHMLWFLHLACEAGYTVDRYVDEAVGLLKKDPSGRVAITKVTIKPVVAFSGRQPTPVEHEKLHHEAHEKCFIANSLKSEVICEPRLA